MRRAPAAWPGSGPGDTGYVAVVNPMPDPGPARDRPDRGVPHSSPMLSMSTGLRCLLITEAERARIALDAEVAAVSRWEREAGILRTLVNVGTLRPGEERFPADETYPLDAFPAVAALLREGRAYLDPGDVSSASLAASQALGSHAAVPVVVEGATWGELWVARTPGAPALTELDVGTLRLGASRLGDGLARYTG
jgi:GAF domain-containing protein